MPKIEARTPEALMLEADKHYDSAIFEEQTERNPDPEHCYDNFKQAAELYARASTMEENMAAFLATRWRCAYRAIVCYTGAAHYCFEMGEDADHPEKLHAMGHAMLEGAGELAFSMLTSHLVDTQYRDKLIYFLRPSHYEDRWLRLRNFLLRSLQELATATEEEYRIEAEKLSPGEEISAARLPALMKPLIRGQLSRLAGRMLYDKDDPDYEAGENAMRRNLWRLYRLVNHGLPRE
jgi:hypothetical protein